MHDSRFSRFQLSGLKHALHSSTSQAPHRAQASAHGISHACCQVRLERRHRGQNRQGAAICLRTLGSESAAPDSSTKPKASGPSSLTISPTSTQLPSASRSMYPRGPSSGNRIGKNRGCGVRGIPACLALRVSAALTPWPFPGCGIGQGSAQCHPRFQMAHLVASASEAWPSQRTG